MVEHESSLFGALRKKTEIIGDLGLLKVEDDTFLGDLKSNVDFTKFAAFLKVARIAVFGKIRNDDFRSPSASVEIVHGPNDFEVIRKENSILYAYDLRYSMFCRGNLTEKVRLSQLDCTNEVVVDLFAGIGYFTLTLLKSTNCAHLYAYEWNPRAVGFLKKNLVLNKIDRERYSVEELDCRECPLKGLADRVNLGLLPSSEVGWMPACRVLRNDTGGVLHLHQNIDHPKGVSWKTASQEYFSTAIFSKLQQNFIELYGDDDQSSPWTVSLGDIFKVKSFGPCVTHVVFDISCRPANFCDDVTNKST